METAIGIISKICDFLGGLDYAKAFDAIEKVLRLKVIDLPIDPQLMGALGAAEFARQKGMAKA